jgi:hypothetical protein
VRALWLVLLLGCSRVEGEPGVPGVARSYEGSRSHLEERRVALARELGRDRTVVVRARELLVATLRDEILPAWDGTPWDFNGTSQTPGQGQIACGYFVSTTLLHLGLRVERARMGQQASEHIAKSLASTLRRSSDQPIDAFLARVRADGQGIYVVGLDNHVGFLIVDGEESWFHHAGPRDVVKRERAREAPYLVSSRYRVFAKLFDDALVEKWLLGTPIPTVMPQR